MMLHFTTFIPGNNVEIEKLILFWTEILLFKKNDGPESLEEIGPEHGQHDNLADHLLLEGQAGDVVPVDRTPVVHDLVRDRLNHLGVDVFVPAHQNKRVYIF